MKPNKIPIRLEHDGLSNALVNITFSTVYQSVYIVERVIESLAQAAELDELQKIPSNGTDGIMIANSSYRIQIMQNMISFNFVSAYTGWNDYRQFIIKILNHLSEYVNYEKVALRYISGFEDISLFNNLDGSIQLNQLPPFYGTEFHFGFQIQDGNDIGISDVRITDKLPIDTDKSMSVMDINMVSQKACGSIGEVLEQLDFLHKHEKNVFFLLLRDEFVNTLGPTYE